MIDPVVPILFLGLSFLLVAVSLTAVLIVAVPALQELARAARSAEKLFDTLRRELPPTLEAIRLTGLEISDLTDDVSEGVKSAGQVVKQVDQSLDGAKKQAQKVQVTTRGLFAGVKAAFKTFTKTGKSNAKSTGRRSVNRLPRSSTPSLELSEGYPLSSRSTPPSELPSPGERDTRLSSDRSLESGRSHPEDNRDTFVNPPTPPSRPSEPYQE